MSVSKNIGLIGITGKKHHGKSTAAQVLIDQGYEDVKFAGGLKTMLRALLSYVGVDAATIERMIEGDLKEVPSKHLCGHTPRYAMQSLGTEWGRKLIGDAIWTDATLAKISNTPYAVVTDMRYPNEVDLVRQQGGTTIRIVRPDVPLTEGSDHSSETGISSLLVDFEITNDGCIAHLHDQIEDLL